MFNAKSVRSQAVNLLAAAARYFIPVVLLAVLKSFLLLLEPQFNRCSYASCQVSLDAEDIRNEKVKVLRSMKVVAPEDVVMGQYRARGKLPGYLDDKTVPQGRCDDQGCRLCLHVGHPGVGAQVFATV
jgi:hypothetical protein